MFNDTLEEIKTSAIIVNEMKERRKEGMFNTTTQQM